MLDARAAEESRKGRQRSAFGRFLFLLPTMLLVAGAACGRKTGTAVAPHGATSGTPVVTGSPSPKGTFEGHWDLAEGLDDPTGIDVVSFDASQSGKVHVGPSSASIDIDSEGKIVGGMYATALLYNDACDFVFTGGPATGYVTATSGGGIGQVFWPGPLTRTGPAGACFGQDGDVPVSFQFGIVGDDLFMCRSNMAPSLSVCTEPYPRLVARFYRAG